MKIKKTKVGIKWEQKHQNGIKMGLKLKWEQEYQKGTSMGTKWNKAGPRAPK